MPQRRSSTRSPMLQPFLRKLDEQAQQKTSKRSPMFQLRKATRSPFFQPFSRKTDRQGADSRQRCMRLPALLAAKPACVKPMHVSACTVTGGHTRVLTLTLLPQLTGDLSSRGRRLACSATNTFEEQTGASRVTYVSLCWETFGHACAETGASLLRHLSPPPPTTPPTTHHPPTTPTPHHSPHRTHTIPPHFLLTLSASSTVHVLDRLPLCVEHRHREV